MSWLMFMLQILWGAVMGLGILFTMAGITSHVYDDAETRAGNVIIGIIGIALLAVSGITYLAWRIL